MSDGRVDVRERATGRRCRVWPVDARELLASGEYEPADPLAERIADGAPAFPLSSKATTAQAVGPSGAPVPPQPPPPVAPSPAAAPEPAAAKRSRGRAAASEG